MKILLFANTDWFLFNFKLSLARALRGRGHEVVLLSPPGEYGPRLEAEGFRWLPFPVSRSGVNPLSELGAVMRLRRLYRQEAPDLVHHFTIKCVIYGSIAARLAGIAPVVNSITGLGFALLASTVKARMVRPVVLALYRVALRGTEVVFQNHDNQSVLHKAGVLKGCRSEVIPGDGIDIAKFVPPAMPREGKTVLMLARLLYSKGITEYVEAARRVHQQDPSVVFLMAGDVDQGNPECVTTTDLSVWRAAGDVEFLGHRSDVVALNQRASIVVLASTQGEGVPRSLLEGAACACAMVATDVPGCRGVVRNGATGLLVPPANAGDLAAAILHLCGDAGLRERMGRQARAMVEAEYSDECIVRLTTEIYERAMGVSAEIEGEA